MGDSPPPYFLRKHMISGELAAKFDTEIRKNLILKDLTSL